jgi:hypothetical protein
MKDRAPWATLDHRSQRALRFRHGEVIDAQVSRDIEVTTDAGEKFHLVHLQGTNFDIYTEADNKKIGSVDLRTQNPVVIGPDYAANGAAMSRVVAAAKVPGHTQCRIFYLRLSIRCILRSSTFQSDFIMDSSGGGVIRSSLLIFPDMFQVLSDRMTPSWG